MAMILEDPMTSLNPVMKIGKQITAAFEALYKDPAHPCTVALLKSIPVPDPTVRPDPEYRIEGELPSPLFPPSGCRFRTRCPLAQERCAVEEPQLRDLRRWTLCSLSFPCWSRRSAAGCGCDQWGWDRALSPVQTAAPLGGSLNVGAVRGNEPSQG
jgi:oligopeptide/dipeptide ABC transporter ATP-binding protein